MAIREDLVASAVKFLQDPSVSSSPVENKVAFLQSKKLTKDEIDSALARTGTTQTAPSQPATHAVAPSHPSQAQPYGSFQQTPYGWQQQQQQPPPVPKRDWRDWFIMATVMGGVSFGLYTLTKRYVMPLIAPPTPEKLEQDKQAIDEKFDKAFALIDQLSSDTAELKEAERARTERLDKALSELETVIADVQSASRRREDDAQRLRDDVKGLKDAIPKAINAQKDLTDGRLRDLNGELKSLKTLLSQRVAAPTAPSASAASSYLKASGNSAPGAVTNPQEAVPPHPSPGEDKNKETTAKPAEESTAAPKSYTDYVSSLGRPSPFNSGTSGGKAAIPAWQIAMSTKSTASTPEVSGSGSAEPSTSS